MAKVAGFGPSLAGRVGGDEDAEASTSIVGCVEEFDGSAEGSNRNRRPAHKLDGGPAFKLQPYLVAGVEEGHIVAVDPEFDNGLSGFWNEDGEGLTGFQHFTAGLGEKAEDDTVAGGLDLLGGLAGEAGLNGADGSAGGGAGGVGVFDKSLVVGLHFLAIGDGGLMVLPGGVEGIAGAFDFGSGAVVVEAAEFNVADGGEATFDELFLTLEIETSGDESGLGGFDAAFGGADAFGSHANAGLGGGEGTFA